MASAKCFHSRLLVPQFCFVSMFEKENPSAEVIAPRSLMTDGVCSVSAVHPGLGVLGDGDRAGGSEGTGPGLATGGAALHGDPAQQRAPGLEERPHDTSAQLHPGPRRPRTAAVCPQR